MPKGRIGLSLDEDVLTILDNHSRSLFAHRFLSGGPNGTCGTCGVEEAWSLHKDERPTRTEIVQTAVREWAARQKETYLAACGVSL